MMSSFKADSKTANPGLNKGNKYTCELTFFIIRVKSSGKTVPRVPRVDDSKGYGWTEAIYMIFPEMEDSFTKVPLAVGTSFTARGEALVKEWIIRGKVTTVSCVTKTLLHMWSYSRQLRVGLQKPSEQVSRVQWSLWKR